MRGALNHRRARRLVVDEPNNLPAAELNESQVAADMMEAMRLQEILDEEVAHEVQRELTAEQAAEQAAEQERRRANSVEARTAAAAKSAASAAALAARSTKSLLARATGAARRTDARASLARRRSRPRSCEGAWSGHSRLQVLNYATGRWARRGGGERAAAARRPQ